MQGDSVVWLPELVLLEDSGGDWERFLETVYRHFVADFVDAKPVYQGRRLGLKRHPVVDGKEATFWHMTSEGRIEQDRGPNIRRMERIRWPKPVIEESEESEQATVVKVWRNIRRKNEERVLLWVETEQYLVVLADRGEYILPWTAYQVTRPHQQRKLQKEFERYWESVS